jgi:hypothetical protein
LTGNDRKFAKIGHDDGNHDKETTHVAMKDPHFLWFIAPVYLRVSYRKPHQRWIHIKPMQDNLFYHLVMKSTKNARTGMMTSVLPVPVSAPAVFDPVKGVPLQSVE